ncbi:MAG: tRNA (adenosine(37)-N6)-threonylcarbamoyltransferase complex dimerization subunit type 1 TsaB [Desulfobacterales bacterium]|nr:tRNA (adenosine(37)-N6)-threonylcarbamoyltransferase complex dimerization subunit type 1 TsaB [Desulfobacterales bacterium]
MKILAIDTASRTCSVAICYGESLQAEITDGGGETHSRHLMGMVAHALEMSGDRLQAMDAIAVNRGPGSFTGVRIGISTAKGLAAAAGMPLVGVSGLAALAWQAAPTPYEICAMLDARRQEVYSGRYRVAQNKIIRLAPDAVCAPEEAVREASRPCVLIGDGAVAYRARLEEILAEDLLMPPSFQHAVRAGAIALAARPRVDRAENDLAHLVPKYLRPSYAQEPVDKS